MIKKAPTGFFLLERLSHDKVRRIGILPPPHRTWNPSTIANSLKARKRSLKQIRKRRSGAADVTDSASLRSPPIHSSGSGIHAFMQLCGRALARSNAPKMNSADSL